MRSSLTLILCLFVVGCTAKSSDDSTDTGVEADTDTDTDTGEAQVEIGDFYEGGVVFYLDESGFGLIASISDLGVADWSTLYTVVPDVFDETIGSGEDNTNKAVTYLGGSTGTYAVHLCYNATDSSESDWYLPSKDELWELMLNKELIDAVALANGGEALETGGFYWSSTQVSEDPRYVYGAYSEMRDTSGNSVGPYAATNSKNEGMHVRAIRSFYTE